MNTFIKPYRIKKMASSEKRGISKHQWGLTTLQTVIWPKEKIDSADSNLKNIHVNEDIV